MGQGHMSGASGSYIRMGGSKPSGSAERKPANKRGNGSGGNKPGPGAGPQPMGANPAAKKGMMGMGRD